MALSVCPPSLRLSFSGLEGDVMSKRKTYLGDGAYYECHGYAVRLSTPNGIKSANEIYLGSSEIQTLIAALCRDYGADKIRSMCTEGGG